jgi:TolB protein
VTATPARLRVFFAAVAAASTVFALGAVGSPAQADPPPLYNGLIAFDRLNTLFTMRPDGTVRHQVALDLAVEPAWRSADQISFIDTPDPSKPGQNLVLANADGTGAHVIVPNADTPGLRWSPDGTQFAFWGTETGVRKQTIHLQNADGSNDRQPFAGDAEAEMYPAWLGTSGRIALIRGGDVVTADLDGTNITTVAATPDTDYQDLSASHLGDRLVFTKWSTVQQVGDVSHAEIYTANSDGTSLTKVGAGEDPTFSPDGTMIAYAGVGDSAGIWVMNADGTNPQRLTTGSADRSPVWQPRTTALPSCNGKLALVQVVGNQSQLFTANSDGTGLTDLGIAGTLPSWSADGSELGYVNAGFNTANADGTSPVNHGAGNGGSFPSFSPDLTKVAYSKVTQGYGDQIFVSNIDGSNEVALAPHANGPDMFPMWSADGSKITFQSNASGTPKVWVMNADGTGGYEIPNQPVGHSGTPRFSPDATKVVFVNDPAGNNVVNELFVIGVDGTGVVQVGSSNRYNIFPSFSPDGTKIVYPSTGPSFTADSGTGVYVMNADGSDPHQITRTLGLAAWQPLPCAAPNLPPRAIGTAKNKQALALFADGGASFDGDGTIVSYEWRWGDNTAMTPKRYAWHKYAKAGTDLVRLTVTDDDGAKTTKKAWVKVA